MDNIMKKVKGSYTVEMALISGVWLLVIFASVLLISGSLGKVWDDAVSYQIAVYGSQNAINRISDGVEEARKKTNEYGEDYSVLGSKREITVSFQKKLKIPLGNLLWERWGNTKSKVIRPVLFIEKVQKSRRFWENISD